jgi:hypothetical protein
LTDHVQRSVDAVQARTRRNVLPALQERDVLRGADRFDLAPQRAEGQAMDTR